MKKILSLLTLSALALSCGPSILTLQVRMRYPSSSGMDIAGKSISVICVEDKDSVRMNSLTESFASGIEEELFDGQEGIGLFKLNSDYKGKETLVDLVVDTESDVVFLFDKSRLHCYDSCDPRDRVFSFTPKALSEENSAAEAGKEISKSFIPKWKTELYTIYYYEDDSWLEAVFYAEAFDWAKAMDKWLPYTSSSNVQKASCACYNTCVACYMLGYSDLALEWLDRSDSGVKSPLSDGMRKRINLRKSL